MIFKSKMRGVCTYKNAERANDNIGEIIKEPHMAFGEGDYPVVIFAIGYNIDRNLLTLISNLIEQNHLETSVLSFYQTKLAKKKNR